ncbi:amidohydrolase family protein [Pseudoroseomonas ludipueritiae]|uniref:Amidohydrolase family protein n=1 Tax=Pseudoroseomonas ludipueritiae TaxID=198093 RepID=A0ABR7R5Z0_9PROT|nr:amidohydrolase family protein [Pseudoroseomonas ludipueritiae]MBC9177170.1 amidohydrolase family protein [Pseudoroseomonas ludipueritiae]
MTAAPHSAGTAPPRHPVPAGACDAHLHVLDNRFPGAAPVSGMTLADYRLLQRRIGTSRAVLVQAKHHGTDPAALLDALAQLGPDGRGIAVLPPGAPDEEFRRLNDAGVRGLRLSLWNPADAPLSLADLAPLAARVAPLGWHLQLHLTAAQILEAADVLAALPCPVVFDHMARLPPEEGPDHPAFAVVARLLQSGRAWAKLSGAYLNTRSGPPYPEAGRIARAFIAEAPERLVWGSDWPHVTEPHKPDDALLLDLLADWAGPRLTDRILVDNPATLYGFA